VEEKNVLRVRAVLGMALVLILAAVGCGPPVLAVRHRLAPDLPIPAGAARVSLGEVTVADGPADGYAAFVAERLTERLDASGGYGVATREATGPADLVVGARLGMETKDVEQPRTVRRLNPDTRQMEIFDVPGLVCTVEVLAAFDVRVVRTGRKIGVETRRSYRSTDDPRTRGPLGLERPDDPANVPAAEMIVRELLDACVKEFVGMLAPGEVTARIPLRPAPGPSGAKGLEAARRGEYALAAGHFKDALKAKSDDANLLFDLAAVSECAGELEAALELYRKVQELTGDRDIAAHEGVARVARAAALSE
jgi:tetratricopeptide (TPR) repeat protein